MYWRMTFRNHDECAGEGFKQRWAIGLGKAAAVGASCAAGSQSQSPAVGIVSLECLEVFVPLQTLNGRL